MTSTPRDLLSLLCQIEPIATVRHGSMIPYGEIYKKAKLHSHLTSKERVDMSLIQLESDNKLEIVYADADSQREILGIRLK